MGRVAAVSAILCVLPVAAAAQESGVLHIKVSLTDTGGKPTPVPRHTLLVSDNPTTAAPRVLVTALDGTASVRLHPGNYTVESDQPVVFGGRAYQWTMMLDIVAAGDATLLLTSANAEVVPVGAAPGSSASRELDLALIARWQDGVVALWTPTSHASGFAVNASGLIVTNQRVIGSATSVEVQVTPTVKVAATVVAADRDRDVAVLRIDPAVAASLPVVSLGCAQPATIRRSGQELVAIGAPLRQQKGPAFGSVERVDAHTITTDFILPSGSAGGPVFTADAAIVGLTSVDEERADERRQNSRVVGIADVCDVVASAEKNVGDVAPPNGTHLPLEPATPFREDALKQAARHHARSVTPYRVSSSDFDITFVTPVLAYAARTPGATSLPARGARPESIDESFLLTEFGNWSEYVRDLPPVLLVRVTPKLVEGFWQKVGRGAALTQGMALPAFTHPKSAFSRLRAFCGDAEVPPIHPLKIAHRISATATIDEGLYVFDPGALAPSCQSVRLVVYSKDGDKGDARAIDMKIIEQVWDDFAAYRVGTAIQK